MFSLGSVSMAQSVECHPHARKGRQFRQPMNVSLFLPLLSTLSKSIQTCFFKEYVIYLNDPKSRSSASPLLFLQFLAA